MFNKEKLPSLIGFPIVLLAAGAVWFFTSGPSSEVFPAKGSTWYLTDAEWVKYEGKWRVSGEVQPKKIKSDIDATLLSLTHSMCGAILTDMVAAPEGVKREDVFRVSLRVGGKGGALLADFAIPTPVMDGECALTKGDIIYPSYPGVLGHWAFHGTEAEMTGDTRITEGVTFVFKPMVLADSQAVKSHRLPDYQQACRLAIADVRNGDAVNAELISGLLEKANNRVAVKVVETDADVEISEQFGLSDWMEVTDTDDCVVAQ